MKHRTFLIPLMILIVTAIIPILAEPALEPEPVLIARTANSDTYLIGTDDDVVIYETVLGVKNALESDEDNASFVPVTEVVNMSFNGDGYTISWYNFSFDVNVYVNTYSGVNYSIQDLRDLFPAVNFKKYLFKSSTGYKYGVNFTEIPGNLQDKVRFIALRAGNTVNFNLSNVTLEANNKRLLLPSGLILSYHDLLRSNFTLTLFDKRTVLIGNVTNKSMLDLDPTVTLNGLNEDGDIEFDNTASYTKDNTSVTVEVCTGGGGGSCQAEEHRRVYLEFDTSSIPDEANINTVVLNVSVNTAFTSDTISIKPMANQPTTRTTQQVFDDAGDGTAYVTATTVYQATGWVNETLVAANITLENQLVANWFAVGLQSDNEPDVISEQLLIDSSESASDPQLRVTYGVPVKFPMINFTGTTPPNGTSQTVRSFDVNLSITNLTFPLREVKYTFNKTNYTYYNDSLVFMMSFDNISSLGESDTVVKDFSAYGDDGTGAATWAPSGKYGGSFWYNTSSDGFTIPDDVRLDGWGNATLAVWVYPRSCPHTYNRIIDKFGAYTLVLLVNTCKMRASWQGSYTWQADGPIIAKNQWTHLAVTWNGTDTVYYVNGTRERVVAGTDGQIRATSGAVFIGHHSTSAGETFNGSIDEVRMWNISLNDQEIYQQYAGNLRRHNSSSWELFINQSETTTKIFDVGAYTYQAYVKDTSGNSNFTEERTITFTDAIIPFFRDFKNNASGSHFNSTVNFSIYILDDSGLSTYIFSTNSTGQFDNVSNATISGTNYSAEVSYTLNLTKGEELCGKYWANDSSGNVGESNSSCFIVANRAPTHSTPLLNSTDTDLDDITVNLTCYNQTSDDIDEDAVTNEYTWFKDSVPVSGFENATYVNSTELTVGDVWICMIQPFDSEFGEELNSSSLTIQATPLLSLTIISPEEKTYANESIHFNVSTNAAALQCLYSLDGRENVTMTKRDDQYFWYINSSVPDNKHSVTFSCSNLDGAWSTSINRTFAIDTVPPAVDLNYPLTGTFLNSPVIQFNYTAIDETGIANCSIFTNISGLWLRNQTNESLLSSGVQTNFTMVNFTDGDYLWNIECEALNEVRDTSAQGNQTITVDTLIPRIAFTDPTPVNNTDNEISILINVSINDTRIEKLIFSWNESNTTYDLETGYINWSINKTGLGYYDYYVWVNDSAGNINFTETRRVHINDTGIPRVELRSPADGSTATDSSVNFAYNVSDDGEISNCSLNLNDTINTTDDSITQNVEQTFSVELDNATYDWNVTCADINGNLNTSLTRTVIVALTVTEEEVAEDTTGGGGGGGSGGSGRFSESDQVQKLTQPDCPEDDTFLKRIKSSCKLDNGLCDDGENFLLDDDCKITQESIKTGNILYNMWVIRLLLAVGVILLFKKSPYFPAVVILLIVLFALNGAFDDILESIEIEKPEAEVVEQPEITVEQPAVRCLGLDLVANLGACLTPSKPIIGWVVGIALIFFIYRLFSSGKRRRK